MPKVFVTDAQMRSSLAVIRSLGKKGITVTAGEETIFATGFFSKYCSKKLIYPSPKKYEDEFIACIINHLKNNKYDALIPVADACLKPIIDNAEEISQYAKIGLPPKEIFLKGYDKGITLQIAKEFDIPCPQTFFLNCLDDISRIDNKLTYPLIIKPRISSGSRGMVVCANKSELINQFKQLSSVYNNLLAQEYIPNGGEIGVYTLVNYNSEPRALSVQQRIRSYPISGGPSTLRQTIKHPSSDQAIDFAFKLLKAMKWQGIAMVEFRIDPRDGIPKLMEVNPRFWGSLQLSILSGIDFPYLLYRLLMDGDVVNPEFDYKEGVKCRWLLPGEILWYMNSPDKINNFKELLNFSIPDDIISSDDPGPTFGFFAATMRYLFDKEMWKFVLRR